MRIAAAIVASVTLFLLSTNSYALWGEHTSSIKVGVVLPLTGTQAKFGEIEKRSFEMAAEEINGKGGVNGKKLELLFEDDGGKPHVGRAAVEKLVSQYKVPVLTGGYSSSVTAAAAPVAQQFKVPFVICTGSADDITEKGYDYIFRINPAASEYPKPVMSFLQGVAKDVKTVALLYENTMFGQSSAKSFEKDAAALGLEIVLKEGYQAGAIDFKPVLTKVKAANPDMIYMVSYVMDASLLMRQSKELRINPKLFVGGGSGFTLPEFAKSAGDASDGVYSATLWVDTLPFPGAKEYASNFRKKFGSDTEYHGAEAYAAMYVVADALKRAKSITPKDVRDALVTTDMMTAFGPVKFVSYGKKTQQNRLSAYLVQWRKGTLELAWPKDMAARAYAEVSPSTEGSKPGELEIQLAPKLPPSLIANVSLKDAGGDGILDAGESAVLEVTVRNTGKGEARNIAITLQVDGATDGVRVGAAATIEALRPGEGASRKIAVESDEERLAGTGVRIKVNVTEGNGFDAQPSIIAMKTRPFAPPDLKVMDVGINDDAGNGNGRIEPGEVVEITARIGNKGPGDARDVVARVKMPENVYLAEGKKNEFPLGEILAGGYKDIRFSIFANQRAKDIPIGVEIQERHPRLAREETIPLALNRPERKISEISVASKDVNRPKITEEPASLAIDVDSPPKGKGKNPDAVAVVIGNRDYSEDVPRVEFAVRDASVVRDYLVQTFGYSPENIIYLENITKGRFESLFGTKDNPRGELYSFVNVKPGVSDVFVYYSGHGAPDTVSKRGAYIVPVDTTNASRISLTGYPLDVFYRNLAALPAKSVTVVMDSCFSGAVQVAANKKGMLLKNVSPIALVVEMPSAELANGVVLSGARGDQLASWYPEKRHGLFTYFFLKGVSGAADVDGDGMITAGEIASYLETNVGRMALRLNGQDQKPFLQGDSKSILVRY